MKLLTKFSIVCVVFSVFSFAQPKAKAQGFQVSLHTDKNIYAIGEPVVLNVVIRLVGQVPITINHPLDGGVYKEAILIAQGDSTDFRKVVTRAEATDARIDRSAYPTMIVKPDEEFRRMHTLLGTSRSRSKLGEDPFIFSRSGKYQVRFVVQYDGKNFFDTVSITISEPTTDADNKAWLWLQQSGLVRSYSELDDLPENAGEKRKVLAKFQDLKANFPDSTYAKIVMSLEAERSPNAPSVSLQEPPDHYARTVKELESQWYDIKNFWRDRNSPWSREYAKRRLDLYELQFKGKLRACILNKRIGP